ncbi:uncharacterized protein [Rhodnius prolixus]|uniref:uncharacterized protein n=1 Tax=Rhodnius prolixus TaxID=13249 RepID=UPI003D18F772
MDRTCDTSCKKSGGGVLIAVRKNIQSFELKLCSNTIEQKFVSLKFESECILIGVVYIPPASPLQDYQQHCMTIEHILQSTNFNKAFIVGDYNIPSVNWLNVADNTCESLPPAGQLVVDTYVYAQMHQINGITNCLGEFLDLVFSTDKNIAVNLAHDSIFKKEGYHPPLQFSFNLGCEKNVFKEPYLVFDYRNCDFKTISSYLVNYDWDYVLGTADVNTAFDLFGRVVTELISEFTPRKKIFESDYPNWFSKELITSTKKKKAAHQQYRISLLRKDYEHFSKVRAQCKKLTKRDYAFYIHDVESAINESCDIKDFWNYINRQKNNNAIPDAAHFNNTYSSSNQDTVNLFAEYFSSVYNKSVLDTATNKDVISLNSVNISMIEFSTEDVLRQLSNVNIRKGTGPDGIPSAVLKNCQLALAPILASLFTKSIKHGIYPDMLKTSFVVPIYKSGDKRDVTNYRPICIQSAIAKIFEKSVIDILRPLLDNLILSEQHGFHSGRSTLTNLLLFEDYLRRALVTAKQVDAVYLDFAKAFDRVNHSKLIHKLSHCGIHGSLLDWFYSYLTARHQSVKYKSLMSEEFLVSSGVPQGSILGPFLFKIFINDISTCLNSVNFLLFADDLKIYTAINSADDFLLLQNSLHRLSVWCDENDMSLNISKCKVVSYHRSRTCTNFDYSLHASTLSRSNVVKDLGVTFCANLSFNLHMNSIVTKANKMLGFISRSTRNFKDVRTIIILYKVMVRPILEYCSALWSPYQKTYVNKLESLQRRFLRLLWYRETKVMTEVPYDDVMEFTGLSTLQFRIQATDLNFIFKILNNNINCPELLSLLNFHVPTNGTRQKQVCHGTNYRKFSYFPRVADQVNHLPADFDIFNTNMIELKHLLNG